MEKLVHHPEIGNITYKRSNRARRISISIRPAKGVLVTVPYNGSYAEAEQFVEEKLDWILTNIKKVNEVEEKQTVFTHDLEYKTKFRSLKLIPEERSNLRLHVSDNFIEIYYPQQLPVTHSGVQDAIKRAMEHTWRIEAHEYLPNRLGDIAKQFGFTYKSITIKNTRSFWGSCAVDNSITLSLHLMHLPDKLIDYVLLHELCHTIHKNHGKGFWELLNRVTGGRARLLAKEMRKYSTRIY